MKKTFLLVSLALALTAMIVACGDKKPKLLTAEQVGQRVDSLYQAQVETLGPDLDQACDLKFESLVAAKVDSILVASNPEVQ